MKKIWLVLLSFLLVLVLVSSGCPSQIPKGGTLKMAGFNPATLDPHLVSVSDQVSLGYVVEIFSGLVAWEYQKNSETGQYELRLVPDIAKEWKISEDGLTYTFYLRKNVKFHDGKKVTAQDFKYSLERACDPKTGSSVAELYLGDIVGAKEKLNGEVENVRGVKVINDYTLEIKIGKPIAYFLVKLAFPTAYVLDKENVEKEGLAWSQYTPQERAKQKKSSWFLAPNGTGPFKLEEFSAGEKIVLVRNENYYQRKAHLDKVEFTLFDVSDAEINKMYGMYEGDEIQVVPDIYGRGRNSENGLVEEFNETTSFRSWYIGFNCKVPPFDDPYVRMALALAINKPYLGHRFLHDSMEPASGFIPPGMPGYNTELKGINYNIELAKEYLAKSKYGSAENLPEIIFYVPSLNDPTLSNMVETWQEELGIKVKARYYRFSQFYFEDVKKRELQSFIFGWIADYPDPQNFLENLFHSQGSYNYFSYENPEVDALLEKAAIERDETIRFRLYQKAEELILNDAPLTPYFHEKNCLLIKPCVKNFKVLPTAIPRLKDVYLELPKTQ